MSITTDTAPRITPPGLSPESTTPIASPTTSTPILDGNAVVVGNGVPKDGPAPAGGAPEIQAPETGAVSPFAMSDEQSQMFMALLIKLLQLAGVMQETQSQNMKNRQGANEQVFSSQMKAAEETRTKNRINAWAGIAAGGMALAAGAFSIRQLSQAGAKTTEFSKLSGAKTTESGVSALTDATKTQMKGLGREIDQLNTKAQTITAGANAMGTTGNSMGQMASSQSEYEAAAKEALANLQRKGAESIDQAVSSNQSLIDKLSVEMVASLKSVVMAAVR
jgi:hypothetical protein